MSDLPTLSRSEVRKWTEQRFFDRGENYFQQGRIQRPRREGHTLKAECEGSQPSPYHVEAELNDGGIAWAECSCPMGGGGRCKHVVALLLTWVETPEDFSELAPLEDTLQNRQKEELVEVILTMVDRHPDLEWLVSVSAQAQTNLDVDDLRQEIESVFPERMAGYEAYEWEYASTSVADDLQPYLNLADDLTDQDRLADAVTVYQLLTEVGCDYYGDLPDYDGNFAHFIERCTERMGEIMQKTEDSDLRQQILRALFDTYVADLDLGGHGLGDAAESIILDQSTTEERQQVAGWVRNRLPRNGTPSDLAHRTIVIGENTGASRDRAWKQQTLGGFLLDLLADTLDDEKYLRICRATGRITELVDRLLERDRLDEALDATREASDVEVYKLTSVFEEHDAEDALYDLVLNRLGDETDRRLVTWLRNAAEDREHLDRALDLSRRLFWAQTSESAYERLRSVAQKLDRWDEVQADLHEQLRDADNYALLTRLHLADDNVEAALETVPKADKSFSWHYSRSPLPIEVAEAAEEDHPEDAIQLYTKRGRSLIAERGRDNYREAAKYFQRVKALYDRTQPGAWSDVLEALYDDELHRLPAARDEFEKADLL